MRALLFLLLVANASLANTILESVLEQTASVYDKGEGNNFIESIMLPTSLVGEQFSTIPMREVGADYDSLFVVVKECIMLTKSAYTFYPHLTAAMQKEFSEELTRVLLLQKGLRFYQLDGEHVVDEGALETSACAMGVREGEMMLIMQSGTMD